MRHLRKRTAFRLVLAVGAVALAAGCGEDHPPTYPVRGRVTYADGTPLARGWIELEPVSRVPAVTARGQIQADGTFELTTFESGDGAVAGKHRAAVVVPLPEGAGDDPRALELAIDPRFNSFETSGLEFAVSSEVDENRLDVIVARLGER